ncbi:sensor histidine kinase [Streptacidiphilus carbonis]|uniref:sensor histidine kinase n=1 Tax=Streptacidiphilus carbonis TaxID=105422 RepID=UPI001F1C7501|nr:HAMP domain-containing sensor histidine kinase [Streptacidiphilus carbonis]
MTTTLMLAVVSGAMALSTTLLLQKNLDAAARTKLDQAISHIPGQGQGLGGQGGAGLGSGRQGPGTSTVLPKENNQFGGDVLGFARLLPDQAIGGTIDSDGTISAGYNSGAGNTTNNRAAAVLTTSEAAVFAVAEARGGAHYATVSVPDYGDYMVSSLKSGDQIQFVAVSLSDSQSTVSELIAIEAVVAVAGLLMTGFASFALIRLSLRPLDRVAATAQRISRVQLDRGEVGELVRVPEGDTDTRTEAGQVGDSLNRLIDHVADALSARHASETRVRQFVADASHELRTPLASIAGYAELTRRGRETVPPDTAYALSRVESEAARMTRLVEDLLLLARLDAGRPLDREALDLAPLVMDAVRDAHAASPDHDWQVQLPDDPVMVDGDSHRLHQVLVNLLANAGKHTPSGTRVTAAVLLSPDGVGCELRIMDDGPGIPPALLPSVFERFARGDSSRSRAAGSTGLGLAIVAAVTASHGGRVSVRSTPGNTVFTVRLPLSAEPAKDLDLLAN